MKKIMFIIFILFATASWAYDIETIVVDRCSIEVVIMQTNKELASGLLGYTERTYTYGGMLFEMGDSRRKIFHTEGMQMPIRIMGVKKLGNGQYKVITDIYYAPPGVSSITIHAPDVLEIPEQKYQLFYKNCLLAKEGALR